MNNPLFVTKVVMNNPLFVTKLGWLLWAGEAPGRIFSLSLRSVNTYRSN